MREGQEGALGSSPASSGQFPRKLLPELPATCLPGPQGDRATARRLVPRMEYPVLSPNWDGRIGSWPDSGPMTGQSGGNRGAAGLS